MVAQRIVLAFAVVAAVALVFLVPRLSGGTDPAEVPPVQLRQDAPRQGSPDGAGRRPRQRRERPSRRSRRERAPAPTPTASTPPRAPTPTATPPAPAPEPPPSDEDEDEGEDDDGRDGENDG